MTTDYRRQRLETVARRRQSGIAIVLEDIHDPHNAAAIFRTCDAFGIQYVHLIFEREKIFDPLIVGKQTSSSANKWLDYSLYSASSECYDSLRSKGYTIVSTYLNRDAIPIYESNLTSSKIAVVLGNEHQGLSEYWKTHSDILLTIPLVGFVQSLNVSVTCAIVIYEIIRQRTSRNNDSYALTKQEQSNIMETFLNREKRVS